MLVQAAANAGSYGLHWGMSMFLRTVTPRIGNGDPKVRGAAGDRVGVGPVEAHADLRPHGAVGAAGAQPPDHSRAVGGPGHANRRTLDRVGRGLQQALDARVTALPLQTAHDLGSRCPVSGGQDHRETASGLSERSQAGAG